MPKITSIKPIKPTFADIRNWYNENMSLAHSNIDLNDQSVYEYVYHDARWPGIFQCTSTGAQRLFKKAKPTSILDIAMLTSIYRPGPLAADVDKLYLKAKNENEQYDWGDKRINELLKETYGLLIFQEGVMMLAEKVAGFPKDKCDEVRRAIMKRNISMGDAAKAKVDEMKSEFVAGAVKNGYAEKVASDLYEKIAWFSGYAFNASHATAYAIDSYYCAWLLKHYEQEWLVAYLESMSSNPDNKAEAFGHVRGMGYQFVRIDVNSADTSWTMLPGKKFMPSFLSCKGIGESAVEEIKTLRPFKSIEEMLWNEDGTWRLSKFNRRSLEALIKIKGFDSLDCVGSGKMFNSYHHMWKVIIEHNDEIKKSLKKDPHAGRKRFYELIRELEPTVQEWTKQEQMEHQVEYFGTPNIMETIDADLVSSLERKGVKSIDEYEHHDIYWFVASDCVMKKTKAGKPYCLVQAMGPGKQHKLSVWGAKEPAQKLALYVAEIDANDYGMSTTSWKLKLVS